ncbi:Hypothetical protein B591_17139 [Streptomyces sp. GBA 94-10 4N24]|uniref:hypothetical protein n=1 Tax=Streptomyces TaxID=1883 RepID=UPI0003C2D68D|nr:hypothetical protein [Streptomyces sp. GBA 94-10 4N24]ESP98335.1 Hypothetical protein B591_17139 [Streptomyces sp. GBA 94-10 4N24]UZN60479.1 Hypothetical protein B591N_17139 [Streptomyces sp. GBA 94-10 4N24]
MRKLLKAAALGALLVPAVLGGAASAVADAGGPYADGARYAGPEGAWTKTRASGVTADGEVYYFDVFRVAGPHGAATVTTAAHS